MQEKCFDPRIQLDDRNGKGIYQISVDEDWYYGKTRWCDVLVPNMPEAVGVSICADVKRSFVTSFPEKLQELCMVEPVVLPYICEDKRGNDPNGEFVSFLLHADGNQPYLVLGAGD